MTTTEHYLLWIVLGMTFVLVLGIARAVERTREELEEFRQYMMGEKRDDYEG